MALVIVPKRKACANLEISHGALHGVGGELPGLSAQTLAGPRIKRPSF